MPSEMEQRFWAIEIWPPYGPPLGRGSQRLIREAAVDSKPTLADREIMHVICIVTWQGDDNGKSDFIRQEGREDFNYMEQGCHCLASLIPFVS